MKAELHLDLEGELRRIVREEIARAQTVHVGWLDVAGAAEYLSLTSEAIRSKVARRELPFHRLGKSLRFDRAELDELVRSA